jgi:hypothetical protein
MQRSCSITILLVVLASIASAHANRLQDARPADLRQVPAKPIAKDLDKKISAYCQGLDVTARHECIYSVLARARAESARAAN